jgi:hypothetical protein
MAVQQTQQPQRAYIANSGDVAIYVLTALAMLALGILGWMAGAFFTIVAVSALLEPWGVTLPALGLARWAIPIVVSIVEVALFKFRDRLPSWILAIGIIVTILDFASTIFGIVIAIGGLEVRLFTGFTVPTLQQDPIAPIAIGVAVSALLTFAPENTILSALGMLRVVVVGLMKLWGKL